MTRKSTRSNYEPLISAPGYGRLYTNSMLRLGRELRDNWLWEFPWMSEAVTIYQQMVSGREFKTSGTPKDAVRAMEWLLNAKTIQYDGIISYGFDDLLKRRAVDHLTIGRTILYAPAAGDLEYLDPASTFYDITNDRWYSAMTGRIFVKEDIFVNHAIPIGSNGLFMAPLIPVIPTAMLSWLVREHDRASVDGRKIRDILLVQGQEVADRMTEAIAAMIQVYTEPDPTKHNVPIVWYESGTEGAKASDIVARVGLSEIPVGFNRSDFEFGYVNEIAGATGMSLRHFYNSEKATNRALEEVQEARQQQKGPSHFVRSEQRLINNGKILRRFGRKTRITFIEEVDVQSKETNAKVLKMYAEAVGLLNSLAPGQIDLYALISFLQRDDILPADIDLVKPGTVSEVADVSSDPNPTPTPDIRPVSSDPRSALGKSLDAELGYDEVSVDQNFRIIERRSRLFTIEKALVTELLQDSSAVEALTEEALFDEDGDDFLAKAQRLNLRTLVKAKKSVRVQIFEGLSSELHERAKSFTLKSELTDDDHRLVGKLALDMLSIDE